MHCKMTSGWLSARFDVCVCRTPTTLGGRLWWPHNMRRGTWTLALCAVLLATTVYAQDEDPLSALTEQLSSIIEQVRAAALMSPVHSLVQMQWLLQAKGRKQSKALSGHAMRPPAFATCMSPSLPWSPSY